MYLTSLLKAASVENSVKSVRRPGIVLEGEPDGTKFAGGVREN